MYSLSQSELQALREFINENLYTGFIWSASSPHGAPILFVCKKDGSLWLCIDYQGLNKITKKDCYPLLLISDLLSTAGKAHIYTTFNLRHAYHLVCIAEGDKWKTTFCTSSGKNLTCFDCLWCLWLSLGASGWIQKSGKMLKNLKNI